MRSFPNGFSSIVHDIGGRSRVCKCWVCWKQAVQGRETNTAILAAALVVSAKNAVCKFSCTHLRSSITNVFRVDNFQQTLVVQKPSDPRVIRIISGALR